MVYILGVTGFSNGGHDASACLIQDGEIIIICEEERFSRKKHANDTYPSIAAWNCLNQAKITLDEVDYVAFGWDIPQRYKQRDFKLFLKKFTNQLFPESLFPRKKEPRCEFIPHHLSHAASSFWTSGFEDATVLVMDGQGECHSTSIFYANRENGIKALKQFGVMHSLGYLYKATSGFLGLGKENPGKTMGLASYGKPQYYFDCLKLNLDGYEFVGFPNFLNTDVDADKLGEIVNIWYDYFQTKFLLQPFKTSQSWDILKNQVNYAFSSPVIENADLAASVQALIEEIGIHLVKLAVKLTNCSNVVLAGGVALNCSMNGKIAKLPDVQNFFVFPNAHDGGTSVGAALQLSYTLGIPPIKKSLSHAFWGIEFKDDEILNLLQKLGISFVTLEEDKILNVVADYLNNDKIIGWFQGRNEIGPRALGGRSILASPRSKTLRDKVNNTKGRELWRPLAPSILQSQAGNYFYDADKGSLFMLRALKSKENRIREIEGVVHIDGTSRVQLVPDNSFYGQLIKCFYDQSGVPVLLNTSFNLAGEPIVGSPLDAIKSFFSSSLDVLVINNFLIHKK
ncbi:hypothetical protein H6H01_29000 [Nostoc calcicola FACHB-3891]|nr:hypothetical protein [Nostoc calcicola FACHB-3891]